MPLLCHDRSDPLLFLLNLTSPGVLFLNGLPDFLFFELLVVVASRHELISVHLAKSGDFLFLFQIFLYRFFQLSDGTVAVFGFRVEVLNLLSLLPLDVNQRLLGLFLLLEILFPKRAYLVLHLVFLCLFRSLEVRPELVCEPDCFLHVIALQGIVLNHDLTLLHLLHVFPRSEHFLLEADCAVHIAFRNAVVLVLHAVL